MAAITDGQARDTIKKAKAEIRRIDELYGDGCLVDLGLAKGWLADAMAHYADGKYEPAHRKANTAFLLCEELEFDAESESVFAFGQKCVQALLAAKTRADSGAQEAAVDVVFADGRKMVLFVRARRVTERVK